MTKLVGMNLGSNALKRQMANFTEIPSAKYGNAIKYYSNNGANFKYYNLHTALQSLSEMSLTPIEVNDPIYPTYFDTVAISNNSFVFQTFPICRGSDRRIIAGNSKGIIVSDTMEQMRNVRLNVDWQSEKTSIWSSFTQTTNTGTTETALYEEIDLRRVGSSPFSLRERYTASPNQEVATHAKASLRSPSSYPRYNISATLQDIPSFLFGVDWNYGDFLTINVFGSQVEARINTISIALSSKSEQIDVGFEISESVIF